MFDLFATLDADIGASTIRFRKDQVLFAQGEPADSVFHILEGHVKIGVLSEHGREAVVALLVAGDFCGEACLGGQTVRTASAVALSDGTATRMEKATVARALQEDRKFSERFTAYLLARNIRAESDFVDQLFNSSEKRLARILVLLSKVDREGKPEAIIPAISQETLADMIGTTRSRVSVFMNKFRQLGLIEYNGVLKVRSSLLSVVLHDEQPQIGT